MKKLFALLIAAALILSLPACGNSADSKSDGGDNTPAGTVQATETELTEAPAAADISGWNWVGGELDCFGYSYLDDAYYLSYKYPDHFKTSSDSYSGFQYFGYNFNPSDAEATPNTSPYGLYIYFGQGSSGGATKSSLEEDIEGGLTERELGGRTVWFGELPSDPNTGSHTFAYYLSYEDDDWSRIWILVCDPEADGDFRKTFEESMSFDR